MDHKQLRERMEGLWKETFGDSSAYVKLVFDSYLNPATTAWHAQGGGEIDSALLGVPYEFVSPDGAMLRGLYLCGLATAPASRRHGLMSALLEDINTRAKAAGYDFTFLIPAGEGVRQYYRDRGYHDSFYKVADHYVRGHKFASDPDVTVEKLTEEKIGLALSFLEEFSPASACFKEEGIHSFSLLHTAKDWETVLKEALLSGDPVYLALKDKAMEGVAFTRPLEEGTRLQTMEVKGLLAERPETAGALLKGLESFHPDSNITILRDAVSLMVSPPRHQLWSPFYASSNAASAQYEDMSETQEVFDPMMNARPFGMVRILDLDSVLAKMGVEKSPTFDGYSEKEIVELILRHPTLKEEGGDPIESLLGIPTLLLSMSLMLE